MQQSWFGPTLVRGTAAGHARLGILVRFRRVTATSPLATATSPLLTADRGPGRRLDGETRRANEALGENQRLRAALQAALAVKSPTV